MESLLRKLNNRAEMRFVAAAARGTQALGRTTQAAHSTIAVGDADVPLVEAVDTAVTVGEDIPILQDETDLAVGDAWDAWDRADNALTTADEAAADALQAAQQAHDAAVAAAEAQEKADAAVAGTVDEYAVSASQTVPPTSGWSSTPPAWVDGSWIWRRTTVVYGDGDFEVRAPVLLTGPPGAPGGDGNPGDDGAPGRGIVSTEIRYQAGISGVIAPEATWHEAVPAVAPGLFLWTRTVTTYTDATTSTAFSVAKMGEDGTPGSPGSPGSPGAQGASVSTLTRFYYLSATAPAIPTASPPPAPWLTTEPPYTSGSSANLYEVTRTVLSTGAWSYGPVSLSASFTAAKQAYTAAQAVKFYAEGSAQVIPSSTAPTQRPTGDALRADDQWWVVGTGENSGKFTGVQVYNGTSWQPRQMVADSVLVPGSVGNVLIGNGAIDGMTITGATLRTSAAGQRMQFDSNGLRGFNAFNELVASIGIESNGSFAVGKPGGTFGGWTSWFQVGRRDENYRWNSIYGDVQHYYHGGATTDQFGYNINSRFGMDIATKGRVSINHRAAASTTSPGMTFSQSGPKDASPVPAGNARYQVSGYNEILFEASGGWMQTYGEFRANGLQVFSPNGEQTQFWGPVNFLGDTDWASVSVPGGSGTLEWRRLNGEIKLRFDFTYSSSIAAGGVLVPAFTMPVEARPAVNSPILVQGAGTWPAEGFVSSSGAAAIRNSHTVAMTRFYGSGSWPSNV